MSTRFEWVDELSEDNQGRVRGLLAKGGELVEAVEEALEEVNRHDVPAEFRCGRIFQILAERFGDAHSAFVNGVLVQSMIAALKVHLRS